MEHSQLCVFTEYAQAAEVRDRFAQSGHDDGILAISFEEMGKTIGLDLAFTRLLGWFTLATFIINEIRSILENLVCIGVDVPSFLISGLEIAANAISEKKGGVKQ